MGNEGVGESHKENHFSSASLSWQGFKGFAYGYLLLHPVSMVIFRCLEPGFSNQMPHVATHPVWAPIAHSFRLDMLPMGLVFGMVGAVIASVHGWQKRVIQAHAEDLDRQLAVNARLVRQLKEKAVALELRNARLQELERERQRTTHFIVHDFKGYLSCIADFAERALKAEEVKRNADLSDSLARIRRQSEGMLTTARDLLDLARLQEKPTLKKEPAPPGQLLKEALQDLSLHEQRDMVALDEPAGECPPVMADAALLRRVFWNLITNALKHNEPGTRVVLSAAPEENGSGVVFCCSDSGKAIPRETLARLFEDFQMGCAGARTDSTGLGLAFCKAAVEAHGGRIWWESDIGKGNRFFFLIPFERKEAMTTNGANRKTILVVEDDEDFAMLLCGLLKESGYNVMTAADGNKALDRLHEHIPDLITLDIMMPNKTGIKLYRELRTDERWRDIPVVVITGLTTTGHEVRKFLCRRTISPPDGYLEKPIAKDVLLETLHRVLKDDFEPALNWVI